MTYEKTLKAVKEAIEKSQNRNFTESVDLAINLKNIDLSQPKNRIDEEITLPNSTGKSIKIGVFAKGEIAIRAKEAGADILAPEEIEEFGNDKNKARALANKYDFFIAEAPLMPLIGKNLGPILGPRGKMPQPLTPDKDITQIITKSRDTIKARSKDKMTFHLKVGNKNMPIEELAENIETVLNRIESVLEKGITNIKSVYVKTTMGPAVKVM
ncbi:MAG: 50S ribosomal protein L1 [Methanosarcinales archaeon]